MLATTVTALSHQTGLSAQSRFAIDEVLREGGTIWEWLLLLGGTYLLGLCLMFVAFLLKYRRQAVEAHYVARCWRATVSRSSEFVGDAVIALLLGTPLLLIPSAIAFAILNFILLSGKGDWVIEAYLIGLVVSIVVVSCGYALLSQVRESADRLPAESKATGA